MTCSAILPRRKHESDTLQHLMQSAETSLTCSRQSIVLHCSLGELTIAESACRNQPVKETLINFKKTITQLKIKIIELAARESVAVMDVKKVISAASIQFLILYREDFYDYWFFSRR